MAELEDGDILIPPLCVVKDYPWWSLREYRVEYGCIRSDDGDYYGIENLRASEYWPPFRGEKAFTHIKGNISLENE